MTQKSSISGQDKMHSFSCVWISFHCVALRCITLATKQSSQAELRQVKQAIWYGHFYKRGMVFGLDRWFYFNYFLNSIYSLLYIWLGLYFLDLMNWSKFIIQVLDLYNFHQRTVPWQLPNFTVLLYPRNTRCILHYIHSCLASTFPIMF